MRNLHPAKWRVIAAATLVGTGLAAWKVNRADVQPTL